MDNNGYLGTERLGVLLRKFAVPCIFSLIISCLYNIVDQIFVGNGVGYLGNAATGVIFPITVVGWGLSLLFGDGAAASLSMSLGENRVQDIHRSVGNAILGSFLSGVAVIVIAYLWGDGLLRLIGATDANIQMAHDYGVIIFAMMPLAMTQNTLASIIRADGSPKYVLMKYVGVQGVAAFTVLGFAVYGYSMVTIGFGQGLTTLVSVSWGSREWKTAMDLRRTTNKILFGIGALFAVCFWILGRRYAGLFGCSSSVENMAAAGFRFYALTFLIMGYDVTNSMYFTSCGDALSSAAISALRGIVLLLTFLLLFPAIWGMAGVWMAAPAAEGLTAIVSAFLIGKQKRKMESR